MVRFVIRVANEPARRFRLLWTTVAYLLATLYVSVGLLYLALDNSAIQGNTLDLVSHVLGSLRIHGLLLLALGLMFVWGLPNYRRYTKYTLLAMIVYMIWVIVLAFGQSLISTISYTAFPWYGFALAIAMTLWIFAPPLGKDGRLYRGRPGRA